MGAAAEMFHMGCELVDVQAYWVIRAVDDMGRKSDDCGQMEQFGKALMGA